jgi:hypothetical protein
MPGASNSLALFSLVPCNDRAKTVVADPCNSHLVSLLHDGELALDVGFHIRSKSCNTLATLGRGDTDIYVPGASISKLQCSFEIQADSNVVMLYDRSHGHTTQVLGEGATPFESGRMRKVVVQKGINEKIGMGGVSRNLVQFELRWHQDFFQTVEKIKNWETVSASYNENPRLARTIDETETVLHSRRETRIHTPGTQLKMRYTLVGPPLGSGQFAIVHKGIDMDSGKFMAVKILKPGRSKHEEYYALKREVEILSIITHVCGSISILAPETNTHTAAHC